MELVVAACMYHHSVLACKMKFFYSFFEFVERNLFESYNQNFSSRISELMGHYFVCFKKLMSHLSLS